MEALKLARKQHRRIFTKCCNEYDKNEDKLSNENKILELRIIEEKAKLMISVENDVKNELYKQVQDENLLEKEFDESELYIDRWRKLEYKLTKLSKESEKESCSSDKGNVPILPMSPMLPMSPIPNTLLRYPKIKLPVFDGDVKNWLNFWGQFKKIDKDPNIDNQDKFTYLCQAMQEGSVAEELIKSFPPSGESYERVVKQLHARFGKEDMLIQVYVRDLLALILQKQSAPGWSLRRLYDQLESKLRALEVLGVTREKYAAMLFPLVESSLPDETLRAWERCRVASRRSKDLNPQLGKDSEQSKESEKSELDYLLEFLQDEVESEERISLASHTFEKNSGRDESKGNTKMSFGNKNKGVKSKFGKPLHVASAAELFTSAEGRKCIFCLNSHNSWDCRKARHIPLDEREAIVGKSHCCFLCLKPGHRVIKCHVKSSCVLCGKRHHVLLCRSKTLEQASSSNKKETNSEDTSPETDQALASVTRSPNIMLQTLTVILKGNGKRHRVRAIIDSASQRSYILENTAKEIGYKALRNEYLQHSLFGGNSTRVYKHDVLMIYLSNSKGTYNCHFEALSQPVICDTKPPLASDLHLRELEEAGIYPGDQHCGPIEILIGADIAGKLMTGGYKLLPSGLAAIETRLGWTLMGRAPITSSNRSDILLSMLNKTASITDLWTLDSLGIRDSSEDKTELEKVASDFFLETVKINRDQRYEVRLPWRRDVDELSTNRAIAVKRLNSTTNKLLRNSQLESYDAVFDQWLKEGIIEESNDGAGHYLPHRGVFKTESTTKVRPVFDASCKSTGNISLNDCLMKGPNLLEIIPSLLLRFREKEIGVISDIKQAFLQISVSEEDRKYLKFLWWDDKSREKIRVYQHARVVFGLNCSPYLLGAVIHHHLDQYVSTSVEDTAMKLKNSFYVDNCVASVSSKQELADFIKEATELMASAKFELRGWEFSGELESDESCKPTSVLGLKWNKSEDVLFCSDSFLEIPPEVITRRVILSFANRLFDPIGFICPVTLVPKLLLQESWRSKLSWDSELSDDLKKKFLKWVEDLRMLHLVKIPRRAILSDCRLSLHIFCDACGTSYAAVVFARCQTNQKTTVRLIMAKSRVAPLKAITIPRLELIACCIGVRLSEFVKKSLNLENVETRFWTDSTTALQWIKRDELWNVFVRNRVKEIRRFSSIDNWRHVPGSLNSADLPSRGCSVLKLLSTRWWEGPAWLLLPEDSWPKSNPGIDEEVILRERSKKSAVLMSKSLEYTLSSDIFSYFSRFSKNVRILGWMMRFYHNSKVSKNNRRKGELTLQEINEAENKIIRMIQLETLTEESTKRLKTLNCFRDENGLLRIKTKLTESNDLEDFRYPIVLPGQHRLVKLLIKEAHLENVHAGVQILLSKLREKFWIINGRKSVRNEINKCLRCKRYNARNVETIPIGLPPDRVKEASAFEVSGIDLAGPVILRAGGKAWIVLFTCAIYRAIHLELVLSLSTKAFILSLRRFIARRGRPKIIYSDNGKNFVGTENLLQHLDWNTIEKDTASQKIMWKFIPPAAPWWGGFWERMVQMVKKLLRRGLGNSYLSYEEMLSILCDCESVVNSRPLTYLSEDPNDLIPLTPSMFIQDIPTVGVPDLDELDKTDVNKRWKYQQIIREHLRKRFRREYLGILVQPRKKNNHYDVKLGEVVLLENDSKKRLFWPMAKVVQIYPGKDDNVRVVRLKTSTGEILRPVRKIYPLEIRSSTNETSEKEKADADANEAEDVKTVVTRKGRVVRVPTRFLNN